MVLAAKDLKKRAFSGVSVLVLRDLLKQPIAFFTFLFLSIYLQAWELGVFWAVSEVIGFLGYFSDIGLAAALIQKKGKPSKEEIRTTFTIQQIIVLSLIGLSWLLMPFLQNRFGFGEEGRLLFFALLGGFFTASLKTIPSVQLERRLRFDRLAIVDLAEQIIFSGLAVFMAWKGLGVSSWIGAVLARGIVGVVLIYIFSPWSIGISFDFQSIKNLFNFGLPFQANSLLAVIKDRLVNIFLWGIIKSEGMGIMGWAQKWSQLPLRFLMDSVIRVTFPAYSRMQKQRERLSKALEKTSFLVNLLVFPALAGMGLAIPWLVGIFPQYQKWSIALVPLWLYLINYAFGAATTPLVNAFNAVGKVKLNLKLMVFWTILTWVLTPTLAKLYGVNGAVLGLALVSASSVFAWIIVKKEFKISLLKAIGQPALFTFLMTIILLGLRMALPFNVFGLILLVLVGGLVYSLIVYSFAKTELTWLFSNLKSLIKRKK